MDQIMDVSPLSNCWGSSDLFSKKDKQLLAEFKEQDSYVTSDWSDSEDEAGPSSHGNGNAARLNNSLIDLADTLVRVSKEVDRPKGTQSPKITIRLTRLQEHPEGGHHDDRIAATIAVVRDMGIHVEFGDLADETIIPPKQTQRQLLPSLHINLDPTALVGLCSDIIHHPLPEDKNDTKRRFLRPNETDPDDFNPSLQSKNSKELYKEIKEEIEFPVIESIRDLCEQTLQAAQARGEAVQGVKFWATEEAVRHLREAMCSEEVIGEGMEQRRMRRLLGMEQGDFFEGSRYEHTAGVLRGIHINVFDESQSGAEPMCRNGMTSFHLSLAAMANHFLGQYRASMDDKVKGDLPSFLRPERLPIPKIVTLSLPFPIVSLHAFARGAAEGMTTLTMGNVLFRDIFTSPRWRPKGWSQGNYDLEDEDAAKGNEGPNNAAIWMLPYRSFAEGKRVRFEKGDYSVPHM